MASYKERVVSAIRNTEDLGLELNATPLPFSPSISENEMLNIQKLCVDALRHFGFTSSSTLAGNCVEVHLMLHQMLMEELDVVSYITVGDRCFENYVYCEMSIPGIIRELEGPSIHEPIKAHVWLTLADGTIVDCTSEAHLDIKAERGDFPVHRCLQFIPLNNEEDASVGYHRPFLLGPDFLFKTGMVRPEFR